MLCKMVWIGSIWRRPSDYRPPHDVSIIPHLSEEYYSAYSIVGKPSNVHVYEGKLTKSLSNISMPFMYLNWHLKGRLHSNLCFFALFNTNTVLALLHIPSESPRGQIDTDRRHSSRYWLLVLHPSPSASTQVSLALRQRPLATAAAHLLWHHNRQH